jgi:hypothetical protein
VLLEASNSVLSSMPQWMLRVLKERTDIFPNRYITGWDIGGRIVEPWDVMAWQHRRMDFDEVEELLRGTRFIT